MWYDRDIDAIMRRTRNRPIPAGRIQPGPALGFGVTLAVGSVLVMGLAVNLPAALILALSICFYVFVYTIWLKRRTPQNIVIGGAAGAFPPVIGWAAVTGSVDLIPLVMFAIVFIWTPPHFWSLALWANDDYRRAGVPMLPVVAGAKETRRQILLYTLVLVPLSLVPFFVGFSGPLYGVGAGVLGAVFLERVYRVVTDRQDEAGVSLTRRYAGEAGVQILGPVSVRTLRRVGHRSSGLLAMEADVPVVTPSADAARRRRGRSWAILIVLLGLCLCSTRSPSSKWRTSE